MRRSVVYLTAIIGVVTVGWSLLRPTTVSVAEARVGTAVDAVYATGVIEADPRLEIRSKVSGTIDRLLVREGDRVAVGQVLAHIDNKGLVHELERVQSELRAADLRVRQRSPHLAALEATRDSIAVDVALAESELTLSEALGKKGALAPHDVERQRQRVEKLRADRAAADANLQAGGIDMRADRDRMLAIAASTAARNDETEIRSPIAGTVIRRRVELGEAVLEHQSLLTVGNTDRLVLEVKVDEADIGRVRVGQEVLIDLQAFADRVVVGRIVEIFPDADRDTKTFLAKVELVEPPQGLRSGMSAEVNIVTNQHDGAILVPSGAVAGDTVYVIEQRRARSRRVTTGLRDPQVVEIVDGISAGEQVVVMNTGKLEDGQLVRWTETPSNADGRSASSSSSSSGSGSRQPAR